MLSRRELRAPQGGRSGGGHDSHALAKYDALTSNELLCIFWKYLRNLSSAGGDGGGTKKNTDACGICMADSSRARHGAAEMRKKLRTRKKINEKPLYTSAVSAHALCRSAGVCRAPQDKRLATFRDPLPRLRTKALSLEPSKTQTKPANSELPTTLREKRYAWL